MKEDRVQLRATYRLEATPYFTIEGTMELDTGDEESLRLLKEE